MKFHKDGTIPTRNEIFVFGSNLIGVHGAGAAQAAHEQMGAEWGIGEGFTGQCYAIPTKDHHIRTRSKIQVQHEVEKFFNVALNNPDKEFWITRIGCGLAGFNDEEIAPMFTNFPPNCSFPDTWEKYLN